MEPTDDAVTLAMTMCGEARGEGHEGMQAVGNTVMNRLAKNPAEFGNTVENVCLRHSNAGVYQYSCWNVGDPNFDYFFDLTEKDLTYQMAYGIAVGLIDGAISDITKGATHYFRTGTPTPYWANNKTPCIIIGNHSFFNNIQ